MGQEKRKKRGGEKAKSKSQSRLGVSHLNPKTFFSEHAQTLPANILHLNQTAAKCTTCKWLCAKFLPFILYYDSDKKTAD